MIANCLGCCCVAWAAVALLGLSTAQLSSEKHVKTTQSSPAIVLATEDRAAQMESGFNNDLACHSAKST